MISQRKSKLLTLRIGYYDGGMSINNTHYNLIDTLNHMMGKQKFSDLYKNFRFNMFPYERDPNRLAQTLCDDMTEKEKMPLAVAFTLVDCFLWIADASKNGGAGYGVEA